MLNRNESFYFFLDTRKYVRYNLFEGEVMEQLEHIKGLGQTGIKTIKKLNIYTCDDLINYFPFRYNIIKRSDISTLNQDDKIIIDGTVETIPTVFFINKRLDKMSFKLNIGKMLINVTIFNRAFLKNRMPLKSTVTVIGKYDKKHNMVIASDIRFKGIGNNIEIEPVYHTTYGISNNRLNNYIMQVIHNGFEINDYIPNYFKDKYHFMSKNEAIINIHNPSNLEILNKSILRLKYEELFLFMLKMVCLKNKKIGSDGIQRNIDYRIVKKFCDSLPFKLTSDQQLTVEQIYEDMISNKIMNRLVQGDVGSGKTIVAIVSMYINFLSGYQSAMMAPTEILAGQHYENIKRILNDYDIEVALLTGKTKAKEKREIYEKLSNGEIDIIVGTHALITEDVTYKNLGLVITDEQHRFGVNQRGNLKSKGINPDILYMSATPIPRTYALTVYGDMDISSIKTMPNGRKAVETFLKNNDEIKDVLMMMQKELKENHQIYVVAPLIEDNDSNNMESINDLYAKMNRAFGKSYNIGMLHGKLKNAEKETIMNDFKNNKIQILIATTVIEVGVDVTNATMIVIFDAYRFGLSTLHQLRGRVGRNSLQSYCLLVSDKESKRLKVLTETCDGFKISEEDFLLRGSGDIFGIRQSGDMVFKLSDLKKDYKLLLKVKEDSELFYKEEIRKEENKLFLDMMSNYINLD